MSQFPSSQACEEDMKVVPVHISTGTPGMSEPLFAVPSGYTAVRIPAHAKITALADVHPCDGVDGWIVMETVVRNSVYELRDFLFTFDKLETRQKLIDFISYMIFFASQSATMHIDMDDLRFSDALTRHALHIASALSRAESEAKRLRCYRIFKAIIVEAMFPRADPAMPNTQA